MQQVVWKADSVYSDQTAPFIGSALFAKTYLSKYVKITQYVWPYLF